MNLGEFLYRHPIMTLFMMMISALTFGTLTLNIFYLLTANWEFIRRHGIMALKDGGGQQLAELLMTGFVSILAYLVFKVTEGALVAWLKNRKLSRRSQS